jgi:predicted nucleic acid-binding protein
MIVLCDASPLIFLAKLNQLDLIKGMLGEEIVVLQCVVDEVATVHSDALETRRLNQFLKSVRIVSHLSEEKTTGPLSRNDCSSLEWALENGVDYFLIDERLLRRAARAENLKVIGLLGLLVRAGQQGLLAKEEVRQLIDDAIGLYGLRISVRLYQRLVQTIDEL